MTYLALLRGVNVGGSNTVAMHQLKAVLEAAGMDSVRTYINSGNVIFSTKVRDRARISRLLEEGIAEHFGLQIKVLLLDLRKMRSVVGAIPARWTNDQTMRCDVIFLWPEVDRRSVLKELSFKPEIEDVRYTSGAVIWRIDRKNVARSRMPKLIGTPLYKQMTIRNCNTARKLLQLMEESKG